MYFSKGGQTKRLEKMLNPTSASLHSRRLLYSWFDMIIRGIPFIF